MELIASIISILCFAVAIIDASSLFTNYNGPIAGNKTIQQCINGDRPEDTEPWITTSEMLRKEGYPAEEHVVLTDDGYLLTMHRIPGPKGAPPVFVQHGLQSSSFDFIVLGVDKALAYLLADSGYDVWMGNARGNLYSQCHTNYTTSDGRFWNFSWDQMGMHDLPAEITYVTNLTNQNIIYVGYSLGTTMSYVMAIERPDIASKVKVIFSFASIAYVNHVRGLRNYITPFVGLMQDIVRLKGTAKDTTQSPGLKTFFKYVCDLTFIQRFICVTYIYRLTGFDFAQFNYTLLPTILNHAPAGTSKLCSIQYYQEEKVDGYAFQRYDYGREGNLIIYNSTLPPQYDVSKIQVPVGIFWSRNDFYADPRDVQKFFSQLPNGIFKYEVEYSYFTHFDYIWAIDARKLVYEKLVSAMEEYR